MALTDQQLLLLDNFMYFDGCEDPDAKYANLGEMAQDFFYHPGEHKPDGWELDDYSAVLEAIINDNTLSHLGLGEPTNPETDGLIRGRCFIEYGENGEVLGNVVAFRGTTEVMDAWVDNFLGLYQKETEAQRIAKEYINDLDVDNITVTGHSKGGNLAMYVTMMCGEQIDRCVSYNGQGFEENCLENISEEQLAEGRGKIKSVSSHNDYVHTFLSTIAGRNYYVANENNSFIGRHDVYSLYKYNKDALAGNGGMFNEAIAEKRDFTMTLTDLLLDTIVHFLPEDEKILVGGAGGNLAAAFLSDDFNMADSGQSMLGVLQDYVSEKFELELLGDLAVGAGDSLGEFGNSMVNGFGEIWDGNFWDGLGTMGDGFVELGSDFGGGVMDVIEEVADEFDFLWAKLPSIDLSVLEMYESMNEGHTSSHISSSGHSHGGGGRRIEASSSRER